MEKVKKDLRFYKQLAENTGGILLALDKNGDILFINGNGYNLLGYQNSLEGKNWFEKFIQRDQKNTITKVFQNLIKGKVKPFKNVEGNVITKNKKVRTILWTNGLLKDKNGKVIGTISSGSDITDIMARELELLKQKEQLEKMNELMIGREVKMMELKRELSEKQ